MEHVKPPPSSAATSRCSRRPNLTLPLTQRQSLPLSPPSSTRHSPHHPQISTISLADLDRERRIGGTVYMARNRSTGTSYALKIINADHEDFVRRQIFRQIRILCTIDNPNVVKCHGMFDDAGEIQVVLDYMDGGSLQGTLISNESSLADVARQILCGLSYLHGRKFAHHDIKPSNFLINSQSHVKIAGFGISRTLSQTSVSTIAYISPERIHTDHLSHGLYNGLAGDIWSFGVSILELYLGRFPFEVDRRNDWESLISAICVSQPPEAPASASPEFRHLVACCLQKDQANRWTAVQLLQHPFILHNTL